jgi:hypothetical protein
MLAAVERKSLDNLAATLADGTLAFQLQRLAELPLAAVVVEARYSALYKLEHVHGKEAETTLTSSGASSRTPSQRIGNCDPCKRPLCHRPLHWPGMRTCEPARCACRRAGAASANG